MNWPGRIPGLRSPSRLRRTIAIVLYTLALFGAIGSALEGDWAGITLGLIILGSMVAFTVLNSVPPRERSSAHPVKPGNGIRLLWNPIRGFAGERIRKSREAVAEKRYQHAHQKWSERFDELRDRFEFAKSGGFLKEDIPDLRLRLRPDERVFMVGDGIGLIGYQRERGHLIAKGGSSLGLNVGWISFSPSSSRVEYREGEEHLALLESGTLTLTNQRAVFQGKKYVREWAFNRLIAAEHDRSEFWTCFHVSDQPIVSGILYDESNLEIIRFRIDLAIAEHDGHRDQVVDRLEQELQQHAQTKPTKSH